MSILIKGIDLPKEEHGWVNITIFPNGDTYCRFESQRNEEEIETQAKQIDRPHGRLIDESKVFTYDKIAEDQLKEVPTILEEEK